MPECARADALTWYEESMNAMLKLTALGNLAWRFLFTRYDQEFKNQIQIAEEIMDEYKDALHVLAE